MFDVSFLLILIIIVALIFDFTSLRRMLVNWIGFRTWMRSMTQRIPG